MKQNDVRKYQRLKHERYIHRKRKKLIKKVKNNNLKNNQNKSDYYSNILYCLEHNAFSIPIFYKNETVELTVPKVFCFSKNPDESIFFLRKLYTCLLDKKVKKIHFNHFNCSYLGACASTTMDIILLECIKRRKSLKWNMEISGDMRDGKISYNSDVDSLVKMSGLLKHLGIGDYEIPDNERLALIKDGSSADVAEKSIEYIDRSLKRHGLELTKEGQNLFGRFFGEVVDNCCSHGGERVSWFTLGHYCYDKKSGLGKCKLSVVDFGDTIYEGLKNCNSKMMLKQINHYVKKTWYSFRSVRDEETLYTLFSLQQRTSRIIDKDRVRGNGTVTFIESFLELFHTEDAKYKSIFSITSGKCSILFDGKYKLIEKTFKNGYSNKIITFNKSGNLYEEPDKKYVRTIKNSFPGTVVSMDLYIDKKYLKRSK